MVDCTGDGDVAAAAGAEFDLAREDVLFFATPHQHEVSVNSTRVTGVLGTSVWDLTLAEHLARRQLDQLARFLCERVPGFEQSYLAQSGVQIGVRETRRIVGDYQLTGEDILGARNAAGGPGPASRRRPLHQRHPRRPLVLPGHALVALGAAVVAPTRRRRCAQRPTSASP